MSSPSGQHWFMLVIKHQKGSWRKSYVYRVGGTSLSGFFAPLFTLPSIVVYSDGVLLCTDILSSFSTTIRTYSNATTPYCLFGAPWQVPQINHSRFTNRISDSLRPSQHRVSVSGGHSPYSVSYSRKWCRCGCSLVRLSPEQKCELPTKQH